MILIRLFASILVWSDRYKQIQKKWRALPKEKRQEYVTRAKANKSKMSKSRKSNQVNLFVCDVASLFTCNVYVGFAELFLSFL